MGRSDAIDDCAASSFAAVMQADVRPGCFFSLSPGRRNRWEAARVKRRLTRQIKPKQRASNINQMNTGNAEQRAGK